MPHVKPSTLPDVLTNGPTPALWNPSDANDAPRGAWFPVLTPTCYNWDQQGALWTTNTYGIPANHNWQPYNPPEVTNPVVAAFGHLAATLTDHHNLPVECGRDMLMRVIAIANQIGDDIARRYDIMYTAYDEDGD